MTTNEDARRKPKQHLTVIPETERVINYRFDVYLCGHGATQFAKRATTSEIADEYRPKAKPIGSGSSDTMETCEDDLVLFCPTSEDNTSSDLARIRFKPIEKFEDSLPQSRDPQVVANLAIILLFWPRRQGSSEEIKEASLDNATSDIQCRLAEINFISPKCRPLVQLSAFAASLHEETKLKELIAQHKNVQLTLSTFPDDDEDTVVTAIQQIVEKLIARRTLPAGQSSKRGNGTDAKPEAKKCCNIL